MSAPINVVTGLLGAGKTLYAVTRLQAEERPVYAIGVNGLDYNKLGWIEITEEQLRDWKSLPPGVVILVDECHKYFPQRTRDKVPSYVEDLAEARRHGKEFWFVTQEPMSFDVFIRRRVGMHLHVFRPFGLERAKIYEWSKYQDKTGDAYQIKQARVHDFKYPKKSFELYESAEVHTIKRRLPVRVFLIPIFLIGLLVAVGVAIATVLDIGDAVTEELVEDDNFKLPGNILPTGANHIQSAEQYAAMHAPRLSNLPWTSAFYSEVFSAQTFPKPRCVEFRSQCRCYTQQGTRLGLSVRDCRWYVQYGFFDPTKIDVESDPVSLEDELRRIDRAIKIIRGDDEAVDGETPTPVG